MAGFLARWFLPYIGLGRGRITFGLGTRPGQPPIVAAGPACVIATDSVVTLIVATDSVTVLITATDTSY